MPAATPSVPDALLELRRQLILAQAQLLELEDVRDDLKTRLAEREKLLSALQVQTDQACEAHDHVTKVHAELQRHRDHLQHLLHVANQALEQANRETQRLAAELADSGNRERDLQAHKTRLEGQAETLRGEIAQLDQRARDLDRQLADTQATSAARQQRITELDAEVRGMKASRSWRWTAWLRSIERLFRSR